MMPDLYIQNQTKETNRLIFRKGTELQQNDKCFMQLSVAISSLLNSGGGTIVYGIESKRHKASTMAWVNLSAFAASWLEEVVKSCVEPNILDATINYKYNQQNSSQAVVSINIPSSTQIPHRAADKQYYRRSALANVPMEEYEIRALYQRSTVSELDFYALLNTGAVPQIEGGRFTVVNFYPQFLVQNISAAIEHSYKIELHIPTGLHNPNYSVLQQHFSHFDQGYTVFSVANKSPLFQSELATVLEANICVDAYTIEKFEIEHIILKLYYSNGMKIKQFRINESFLYKGEKLTANDFVSQPQAIE